ncbi:MAG TPA: alanine--tRNA ligase [Patescibacteria group bacterium]|nr:alanine--tRNA ligase [Patescibacteria group bacterium]
MKASDVRKKYIEFFKNRGHIEIEPAPLVLENDPTTLFTSAGMQPLVPYLTGDPYPGGARRLVNSQPSIRLGDIEEVGDNRHTTFFEMLGNWSLGDYFKKEQLPWIFEFFTAELGLPKEKLWVSVFEGDDKVPKDTESFEIWEKLGIPQEKIIYYPAKKNWWSMTGTPSDMQVGHIGGPDSEVFYDFGEDRKFHENSQFKNDTCHPNCDCGRFLEIGNSVFIQYKKVSDTDLEELPQKNVDFGGGLERITAAVNNTPDIFNIDVFRPAIDRLEKYFGKEYGKEKEIDEMYRVVVEHIRASIFILNAGVTPSNKQQGYVLRRLLRRAAAKVFIKDKTFDSKEFKSLAEIIISQNSGIIKITNKKTIEDQIVYEIGKFRSTIERGMNEVKKVEKITGQTMFDLFQSYGFPPEITLEIAVKDNIAIEDNVGVNFEKQMEEHKEKSRTSSAGVFKGGLADHSDEVIRYHTATHLLLASLRKVLGDTVVQKGQNITKVRSRFDFPGNEKLEGAQLKNVEDMINDVVTKDLPVKSVVMSKDEALKTGAIHAFNEKYADTVKIYYVGDSLDQAFSKEFCGGPHVSHTGEIGHVKISKQEKIGAGLVRVYLVLNN